MKRHRSLSLACTLVVGLSLGGTLSCASGTTQTSAGPRPSSTVQIQDAIVDVLDVVNATQAKLVAKHDATPICSAIILANCEAPEIHKAQHNALAASANGLRAAYGGVIAWKQAQDPTNARAAFCQLKVDLPALEGLAVGAGLVKQADVDKWGAVLSAAIGAAGGNCP